MQGLFLRGLGTKIISNGVQAMLFTIVWRYMQEVALNSTRLDLT